MSRQPITGDIRKIQIFYDPRYEDGRVLAMSFYDVTGKVFYESAYKEAFTRPNIKQNEILLNEGERIIGFISRKVNPNYAWHFDF